MLTLLSRHLFFPLWEVKDGAHRREYLRELSRTQWLDPETLRERQWRSLVNVVSDAYRNCPYYHRRWSDAGFTGALSDPSDLSRIPILTKRDVRDHSQALISQATRNERKVEARTGGSTGAALTVWFDERCQELRNAAAMRSDRWAGWDIGMKTAAVWGNPPVADSLRKRLRSGLLDRTIYLDTMDLGDASVRRFVQRWRRERPEFLMGHAHSLYVLATLLERMGVSDIRPRGAVATSMMLLEPERVVIERFFGCAVTNRYGCEEVGLIACECERHDGLHINADHVYVEFVDADGRHVQPGEEGAIVVTDLVNRAMPLVRYRIEDIGVPSDRRCACGRGLPLMERVVGRQADFLKRADGSMVAGVSLVERTLTAIPGIDEMQLVQHAIDRLAVHVVPSSRFGPVEEQALIDELTRALGPEMRIGIHRVRTLDRTRAGKYRFAICHV